MSDVTRLDELIAARHAAIPQDTLTDPHACVDCQQHLETKGERWSIFTGGKIVEPLCSTCWAARA